MSSVRKKPVSYTHLDVYKRQGQITPKILEKIKSEVEKKAIAFKKTFKEDEFSKDRIEFMSDTFRINHIADMRMNIDYSTAGMNLSLIHI